MDEKARDFIEDVGSLIKQYNLSDESADELMWVNDKIKELYDKIFFYEALIGGLETAIKVYEAIGKKIIDTKNKDHEKTKS